MKRKKIILFLTFIIFSFLIISLIFIKSTKASNNNYFVYIDPGHGGFDGGATSKVGDVIEKNITLTVSLYLKNYLEKTGIKVKLTRRKDTALAKSKKDDIYKRVDLINNSSCDIYISIHANAYPHPSVKGAQTFYNDKYYNNEYLAKSIMDQLQMLDESNKRTIKKITDKYLLDHSNKIGCLVELGFLTNQFDLENLNNDCYLEKISFYIYLGIIKYFEESRHYEKNKNQNT